LIIEKFLFRYIDGIVCSGYEGESELVDMGFIHMDCDSSKGAAL